MELGVKMHDVVVVGAGPSGLVAAGRAGMLGAGVLVLERNGRVGVKLRITGKGRCNITNTKPLGEFMRGVYGDAAMAEWALRRFGHADIVNILHGQGVETVLERGDRVYPVSGRAADVAEGLAGWCASQGVSIGLSCSVEGLERAGDGWRVYGRGPGGVPGEWYGRSVVLACGGRSYPSTGSDGSGYVLAKQVGLGVTDILPGLVGFHTVPRLVVGERLLVRNALLSLYADGALQGQEQGDLELTPQGVGGPIALRLSRDAVWALHCGCDVSLRVDVKPALSHAQLVGRIGRDLASRGGESMVSVARSWLPAGLVSSTLRLSGISPQLRAGRLDAAQVDRLAGTMKGYRLRVVEPEGWERAVVTRGGVDSVCLDLETLGAREAQGVYVCGELLDIDAASGGYNLQLAYSTGWVAGESAALHARQ